MGRPSRCRRVCARPRFDSFAPCGGAETDVVGLTVDEYETVRLVDYEGCSHEECARLIGVSRTTVTEIYSRARFKLSDCLVNGKKLLISGGNYRLCDGSMGHCCGKKCEKAVQRQKGDQFMKLAVTYEAGQVFQHFGHTSQFKVYEVEDGRVAGSRVVDTNGQGHGALGAFLSGLGVDAVICGGIGAGAQQALAQAGIKLYGGVSGSADAAVDALLAGTLNYSDDIRCSHHDHHGHEGHCGEDRQGCAGSGHCGG